MRNLFKYTFGTATAGDGGGCAKEKYLNLPRNSLLPFSLSDGWGIPVICKFSI